ncbi:MAG: tetratricopeptide repeat protein, partial [Parachlamydia sp.]|nr:tetratricopeptide repeat protein [Parachlamydia sp.]
MHPVTSLYVPPHVSASPSSAAPPPTTIPQSAAIASPAATQNPPTPMSWRQRGEYHLGRKELDMAVDAFTNALQETEKQHNPEFIGECLKDLGRTFLEKEQWAFSAKIFNGAYALLQKSSNEKSRQATLVFMAEVERRFIEKMWNIKKAIDPKVYLERRQRLQMLRKESHVRLQQETPAQMILLDFSQAISR